MAGIVLTGAALIAAIHFLPGREPLSPVDFVPGGPDGVQFCDPQNPKIIAIAAKSPAVTLKLAPMAALQAGSLKAIRVRLSLRTASGKLVGEGDLTGSPAGPLRLFILSEALTDFQTVQPSPDRQRGDWSFDFIPREAGLYRVFADMTPRATGRELYASSDLAVAGPPPPARKGFSSRSESEGCRFELLPASPPAYAHQPIKLKLSVSRSDGGPAELLPFQGACAHLAIFDEARSGFLALSSLPAENEGAPSSIRPPFIFDLSIPDPGKYVVWVRVDLAGRATDVPLSLDVLP